MTIDRGFTVQLFLLMGARIAGSLALRWLKAAYSIEFIECFFDGNIDCSDGSLGSLALTGSSVDRGVGLAQEFQAQGREQRPPAQ
jgi:hypothetical protein